MRNELQTILFFLCCLPFMAQADETVTYLHHDVLGSVIGTSDNAGKLQKTEYLSYGTKNGIASTESSELGYTGKPHFKDLGLSYYGSRWYDPDAGRFTGIDPVAWTKQYAVHSFNRYSYANNNPYKYVDPDGRYAELPIEVASISIGAVSLGSNLYDGNYRAAGVDAVGVVADVILAIIPIAPGGVGLGVQASRHADEVAEAVANVTKGLVKPGGGSDAADFITTHSQKHMFDASRVSTKNRSQFGKDMNVKALVDDTMTNPTSASSNINSRVTKYSKSYDFNISTPDTPTGEMRVFINNAQPDRSTQFPYVPRN